MSRPSIHRGLGLRLRPQTWRNPKLQALKPYTCFHTYIYIYIYLYIYIYIYTYVKTRVHCSGQLWLGICKSTPVELLMKKGQPRHQQTTRRPGGDHKENGQTASPKYWLEVQGLGFLGFGEV